MNVSKQLTAALACAAALAGGYTAEATTVPGGTEPLTLRIGTDDDPGVPAADQIEEFARQVDTLSGGQLLIEPVWQAAGEGLNDWDQQVARMVVSGDLDLGNIPARTWDTEGVDTFRALHAPFLVGSEALLDRVVADEVADDMLAGLDGIGLTGLALLPEGMRHVYSFGEPLLTPADFAGITVRAPTSETTHALFRALGAEVDDFGSEDFGAAVADGTIAAAESSFVFAGCCLPAPSTVAANVTLFPKANVIVANADVLAGLTAEQQNVLRDAALATRDWAVAVDVDEAELAVTFCRNGGTVVLASDEDVATLRAATEPVYADLERDESTAAMIARIRELAEDSEPGQSIAACDPTTVTSPTQAGETPGTGAESPAATEFPEGVYAMEIMEEFLIDAGVDRPTAFNHAGTWTMTFADGVLTVSDVNASTGEVSEGTGVYCVDDGRVSLGLLGTPPECGDFWSAGWTLDGDQLRFTDVESHHGGQLLIETLFGGQPWTKVE